MRALLLLLTILSVAAPVWAQEPDAEGAKDHPMFSRLPGYYISDYDEQDFASYEFDANPSRTVEGKYWRIGYTLQEGARKTGPLQIARNYTNPLVQKGGTRLWEGVDTGGGVTVARLPRKGGDLWVELQIGNGGDVYTLIVVEEGGMDQTVTFTASDLGRTLADKGSMAVPDLHFDTGKATLRPESDAALAVVAELLKAEPALRLEIQGHTDDVGQPAANLRLSRERAEAVKAHLVQRHGIDAARLTAAGFGDTRPVEQGTTEAARARNRRVELVKQP